MKNKIAEIEKKFNEKILSVKDFESLESVRLAFIGKKGLITELMPGLREVAPENRKEIGVLINNLKNKIEDKLADIKADLDKKAVTEAINNAEKIDITLPVDLGMGSLHPRTMVQKDLEDVFISMGFSIEEGNEIETEYNNFDSLNVPKTHPARDMQDTFWLTNGQLLKTHTSAAQNRVLKKYNGPTRVIFPGRCFRNEAVDHSHENTFFQMEGIVVDENISVANLIYFMKEMLSSVLKKKVEVRLRPGFFPFTEPSFELDVKCVFCGGSGCPTCKQSGWIELCPCGMIHPNVLKEAGLDSKRYSGFAFGLGFDRVVMLRSGLSDIRVLTSGNLKVLKQFGVNL